MLSSRFPLKPRSIAAILPAAGVSRRFDPNNNKLFAMLGGFPVWWHAAKLLRECHAIGTILLAVSTKERTFWLERFGEEINELGLTLVIGGKERYQTVQAALSAITQEEWVAIHDAARPLLSADDLEKVLHEGVHSAAGAILATPVRATLKHQSASQAGCVTVDRTDLFEALTPQVFRRDVLEKSYQLLGKVPVTDDAQVVELAGYPVSIVAGSAENIKITHPEDLRIAAAVYASRGLG